MNLGNKFLKKKRNMTDDNLQNKSGVQNTDDNNGEHVCACGNGQCQCQDNDEQQGNECECDCGCDCDCDSASNADTEKLKELENNWKRALADYKNLEKRQTEEREAYVLYSNTTLLLRILPVLDNLEMLEAHSNDVGLKLIIKEFKKTLSEESVTEVETLNKDFNADLMEAIEMVQTNDESKVGKVVEVLTKGYLLKQKLLRPARVKVGQAKEK